MSKLPRMLREVRTWRRRKLTFSSGGERDRPAAQRKGAAAGPHPQVLACRGTVNQSAWTWSACGPLGPWLTVYSTFWLSARVR